jgi:hypothetical protein
MNKRLAHLKKKWRIHIMRPLVFDIEQKDHEMIHLRLVQACNYGPNQSGSYEKQERTVKLQDLLESIGIKFMTEAIRPNGSIGLVEAIKLNVGIHKLELHPENLFDTLKEHWKAFAESGSVPARDSLKVRDYLANIPSIELENKDAT